MNNHSGGGNGYRKKYERATEALQGARALHGTLESYIAGRDEYNRALEVLVEGLKVELQRIRSNPLVQPRQRERLPDTRESVTWTLRIGPRGSGTACTLCVGLYPDGRVGEVFLRFSKLERGSHGASMADFGCTMMSVALQYGAPLDELLAKMIGAADESGGVTCVLIDGEWTADPDAPMCRSLRDYIGKKLRARFCTPTGQENS